MKAQFEIKKANLAGLTAAREEDVAAARQRQDEHDKLAAQFMENLLADNTDAEILVVSIGSNGSLAQTSPKFLTNKLSNQKIVVLNIDPAFQAATKVSSDDIITAEIPAPAFKPSESDPKYPLSFPYPATTAAIEKLAVDFLKKGKKVVFMDSRFNASWRSCANIVQQAGDQQQNLVCIQSYVSGEPVAVVRNSADVLNPNTANISGNNPFSSWNGVDHAERQQRIQKFNAENGGKVFAYNDIDLVRLNDLFPQEILVGRGQKDVSAAASSPTPAAAQTRTFAPMPPVQAPAPTRASARFMMDEFLPSIPSHPPAHLPVSANEGVVYAASRDKSTKGDNPNNPNISIYAEPWVQGVLDRLSRKIFKVGEGEKAQKKIKIILDEGAPIELTHPLTLKGLEALARNESVNTSGAIPFHDYQGIDKEDVKALKDLVRQVLIVGKVKATHYGGYPRGSGNQKIAIEEGKQDCYVLDLSGVQFQKKYNTGRFFVHGDAAIGDPDCKVDDIGAEIYGNVTGEFFRRRPPLVPEAFRRRTSQECARDQHRFLSYKDNTGKLWYLDGAAYQAFIERDFLFAADALTQQAAASKDQRPINFKFLRYGLGYFAAGNEFAPGKDNPQLTDQFIEASLNAIKALLEERKNPLSPLKRIQYIELPFCIDRIEKNEKLRDLSIEVQRLCKFHGVGFSAEEIDCLKPRDLDPSNPQKGCYATAVTNCGDPHVWLGNEMSYGSVDAAIGENLADKGNSFSPHLNQQMEAKYFDKKRAFALEQKAPTVVIAPLIEDPHRLLTNIITPYKTGWGVRVELGAIASYGLLPGGISFEDAQKGKGIAFIEFSAKDGMTLCFPKGQEEYCQRLFGALQKKYGGNFVVGGNIPSGDQNKRPGSEKPGPDVMYTTSLQITDQANVARFIEEVCGRPADRTRDLYKTHLERHMGDQELLQPHLNSAFLRSEAKFGCVNYSGYDQATGKLQAGGQSIILPQHSILYYSLDGRNFDRYQMQNQMQNNDGSISHKIILKKIIEGNPPQLHANPITIDLTFLNPNLKIPKNLFEATQSVVNEARPAPSAAAADRPLLRSDVSSAPIRVISPSAPVRQDISTAPPRVIQAPRQVRTGHEDKDGLVRTIKGERIIPNLDQIRQEEAERKAEELRAKVMAERHTAVLPLETLVMPQQFQQPRINSLHAPSHTNVPTSPIPTIIETEVPQKLLSPKEQRRAANLKLVTDEIKEYKAASVLNPSLIKWEEVDPSSISDEDIESNRSLYRRGINGGLEVDKHLSALLAKEYYFGGKNAEIPTSAVHALTAEAPSTSVRAVDAARLAQVLQARTM